MVTNPIPDHQQTAEWLSRLEQATAAYLECVRLSLPDAEFLGQRGGLLQDLLNAALAQTEPGTPASIMVAITDLTKP